MTTEVFLPSAVTLAGTPGVATMILYGVGAGILVALIGMFLVKYQSKVALAADGSKQLRFALETAIPNLKTLKWFQNWEKFETILRGIVGYAEKFKDGDADGSKRKAAAVEMIRNMFGVDHEWSAEEKAAVDDAINIALSAANLIGKVDVNKLPFRGGDPDTSTNGQI